MNVSVNKSSIDELKPIFDIINHIVNNVYPHYYPKGAVSEFSWYHGYEFIKKDIESGYLYSIYLDNNLVGVIGHHDNEISRFFVKEEYQHKGIGSIALKYMEDLLFEIYDEIILDASLTGKTLYLNRGYQIFDFIKIEADDDFLCFDRMRKIKG